MAKLRGKVRIGYTPEGKPIDKNISAVSRPELEKTRVAYREHFLLGREIPQDMKFYAYAEQWYRLKKEPFISNASRSAYKSMFMKHLLPTFGMRSMRAISAADIQEFINEFFGTSKSQITMVTGTLKGIFASAYAEGLIERDPTVALVRPKSQSRDERRPLTKEETERVLDVARNHPDGLFLAVLYYLGLRRGEALGLKWGDFDFKEDQVHIERDIDFAGATAQEGSLKTQASERFVPVPEDLKKLLLLKKGRADAYVFHNIDDKPISESSFKRLWSKLMFAAGLTEWRKIPPGTARASDILKQVKPLLTPHYFRHNYVTLLYESGVDPLIAMKIVGHSNYQTTANVYTHIRDEMLKKSVVNMAEVFTARESGK